MGGARIVIVFGTQTGTCKMIADNMAKAWKAHKSVASVAVFEGNEFAVEMEEISMIKDSYDVLVVCTSSFGEGDPPDTYNSFLLQLMLAAKEGSKPLSGLQHAVLGEGSSVYSETFQNCPRLTDKYLEECGSRRFVARHETDVGGDEDESISRKLFREAVEAQLAKGLPSADTPPAAAWAKPRAGHTEPTDQIVVKTEAELGGGSSMSLKQLMVPLLVLGAAAAVGGYMYFVE